MLLEENIVDLLPPGELSQQQVHFRGFQTLLGPKLCSVWYNATKLIAMSLFRVTAVCSTLGLGSNLLHT